MPENDSIYKELQGIYDKETIPSRTAYLYNKIKLFLKASNTANIAIINENILCHMVLDYFADIVRLKTFHNIIHTNKEKITAYTSYWICRRKPIQFIQKRINDEYVFINEAFATTFITDEIIELSNNENISNELKSHLFYHLKYRILDAQAIELQIKSYIAGFTANQPNQNI